MTRNEATRHSCSYTAPNCPPLWSSKSILADYERGSHVAGLMLAAMFAFMSLGTVVLGW